MARTESISIQVHPRDEQSQIRFMEQFHWSLLSSQEIKNIDNHLKREGDSIYQVTRTEHYIKLVFTRDLDSPNIGQVQQLEREYYVLRKELNEMKPPEMNPPAEPTEPFNGWYLTSFLMLFVPVNWWLKLVLVAAVIGIVYLLSANIRKENEEKHNIDMEAYKKVLEEYKIHESKVNEEYGLRKEKVANRLNEIIANLGVL